MNFGDSGGVWASEEVEVLKRRGLVRKAHACACRQEGTSMTRGGMVTDLRG